MAQRHITRTTFSLALLVLSGSFFCAPHLALAQFVPVRDVDLNPAFNQYATNFQNIMRDNPDSIRNIIAASDPGNIAGAHQQGEDCHKGDAIRAGDIFAYENEGWHAAATTSGGDIPTTIPAGGPAGGPPPSMLRVIDSGSLRCLLQDLIGWQKLSLHMQMQALVKQYVSDAQQKQLANQLLNEIHAATEKWGKVGQVVNNNGVMTTAPIYVTNQNQVKYSRNDRTVSTIVKQAAAQPGDPIGSTESCYPLEDSTRIALNNRDRAEDPRLSLTQKTQCNLNSPNGPASGNGAFDMNQYAQDPDYAGGLGAMPMFDYMLDHPEDFLTTSDDTLQFEAARRLDEQERNMNASQANSGFQPTYQCSGAPDDPDCDPDRMILVSPADQNRSALDRAAQSGVKQLEDSDKVDTQGALSSQRLLTELNTEGTLNHDETPLANSKTGVNYLIQEMYDTIDIAYFDLSDERNDWAKASLLMIYDEMKFNDDNPDTVVTEGQDDEQVPMP